MGWQLDTSPLRCGEAFMLQKDLLGCVVDKTYKGPVLVQRVVTKRGVWRGRHLFSVKVEGYSPGAPDLSFSRSLSLLPESLTDNHTHTRCRQHIVWSVPRATRSAARVHLGGGHLCGRRHSRHHQGGRHRHAPRHQDQVQNTNPRHRHNRPRSGSARGLSLSSSSSSHLPHSCSLLSFAGDLLRQRAQVGDVDWRGE